VLAPVASGKPVNGAETPAERLSRPVGTPGTQEPDPPVPAAGGSAGVPIGPTPSADGVDDEPPRPPAASKDAPAPVDDEPPPPPTTPSPSEAVDEEASRPPIDPIVDPVCWDGWSYDDDRRECVPDEDRVPPELPEEGADDEDPGSDDGGGDEHGAAVPVGIGKGAS